MEKKDIQAKPFSNMEVSAFCGQIALILKSGISSIEGITIMMEDAPEGEEKNILEFILERMQESGNLYESLSKTGLFPSYMLHMVEIGEETGTLDEVLEALSNHYDREDAIGKSIKNAVTYPLIMAGMMVAVIIVLLVKVMPIFNQVFVQLGTEMTGFSRMLMDLGNAINRYSIALTVLLVAVVLLILYCTRTQNGRVFCRNFGYHLAFIRPVYEEIAACRFASGMALTLSSGLNPERSMELVSALNDDPLYQEKLEICRKKVDEGGDLSEALHETGMFTGIYARMASIGSRTGSMDQVMNRIAGLYQDDIDNRMNTALAVLEPTLVIALSLIVGVILLSVMLPLMGIMSSL
ncbi:MAG: type II secretion system F family protein [Ruminococcus sp.]|uniref:Type II secretion system F family protein n=1 Tax=Schaedlerella arabinosiphila TaxID=2044587 RepID=A0A3R8JUS6_9FIRM|nr:type II secretion system F family protein [Schaedlerella arabinosiphila]MCI8723281.1 type II secretion system F family protein [Ruminococcus sp.]RRK35104.1 type II secretion system F family protein [Schaedlerella arabinosiphila]